MDSALNTLLTRRVWAWKELKGLMFARSSHLLHHKALRDYPPISVAEYFVQRHLVSLSSAILTDLTVLSLGTQNHSLVD